MPGCLYSTGGMAVLEIWQVDAFTSVPFGGNPAGVVPDARGLTAAQMQKIAREMNLSETAFVFPLQPGDAQPRPQPARPQPARPQLARPQLARPQLASVQAGPAGTLQPADVHPDFEVRFFTPLAEVDLCGHATIATFASLVQEGRLAPGTWHQKTAAGILPIRVDRGDHPGVRVLMGQAEPVFRGHLDPASLKELAICLRTDPSQLQAAVAPAGTAITSAGTAITPAGTAITSAGTTITPAGSDKMVTVVPGVVSTGLFDLLVPLPDRRTLWNLTPDFTHLADFCLRHQIISTHCFTFDPLEPAPPSAPGDPLALSQPSAPATVVHCRDFSPAVGINEESATGTASGALGAYLAMLGLLPSGALRCEQGHILGRPSAIDVVIPNNREVWVGGTAVLVLRGQIMIP